MTVTGLTGGHSGIDIDKGRGSATKLLVRLLRPAGEWYGVRVASLQGGTPDNAIPSEANALIQLPVANYAAFGDYLKKFETTVRKELAATEPKLAVKWITATVPGAAIAGDDAVQPEPGAERPVCQSAGRLAHERHRARPGGDLEQPGRGDD